MPATTLITLANVRLAYGYHALLDGADLTVNSGERIGLIGRNGAGKSSLLGVLDGRVVPDDGEVMRLGGLKVATVEQEPTLDEQSSIHAVLCSDFEAQEDWSRSARARKLADQLGLDGQARIATLSGGLRKRVALARALIGEPDLLLLDEPTNHLDFIGIVWLEKLLASTRRGIVVVTHDRRFLDAVATRIVELDRGRLFSFPGNYSAWHARKIESLNAEAEQRQKFDKTLAQEEAWIRKGVEARRTRNEGRVRRLEQLRRQRAARRERLGNAKMSLDEGQRSGRLVAELDDVGYAYGAHAIVRHLSTTIQRGDRIGIVGANGAGKTTLLRVILGELPPQAGRVRLGTNLTVGYFDQMRSTLDDDATLIDTISPGSEWVEIGRQRRHIMSYLEDFLFPTARAQAPVGSLSGGERARLVLARLFARPTNLLVMDEPTNDLDIETLELLETLLQDYAGTVLLVSHDRTFLNNVVTQILAAEGNGHWGETVGGYDDWQAQGGAMATAEATPGANRPANAESGQSGRAETSRATRAPSAQPKKITAWEQRELNDLPEAIATLESRQAELTARLADPNLYREGPDEIAGIKRQLHEFETELDALYKRWEALEDKQVSGRRR
ncbi:MAG: ATP-binding cassette domain-containing protein [Candidimonas sp.]|nr:MAG: ATP-binding cassette domain-containing protein [Candidimonas sp.]